MATYYVSTSGSNANDGLTTSTPWETSAYALTQAVRGDEILFNRGDKFPPLEISSIAASGATRITFGDYGTGDKPIFSAAVTASGWVDTGSNIWTYENAGFTNVAQVKIDGTQAKKGTFPSSGFYFPTSYSGNTTFADTVNLTGLDFVGGELVTRKERWIIDRQLITGHFASQLTVQAVGSNFNGNGYKIQNHPDCCTSQGDWAYVDDEKKVYLYSTVNPGTLNIEISLHQRALDISSSPYLTFINLVFEMAYEDNIFRSSSSDITFNGCESRLSGRDGMKTFVSPRCIWEFGYMRDIGNNGIFERDTGGSGISGSIFRNSKFQDIGNVFGYGQSGTAQMMGIFINNAEAQCQVYHNYFTRIGNIGVRSSSADCDIYQNYTTQASFLVGDAAAYYTFNANSDGTTIRENIAVNIKANNDGVTSSRFDSCGIYGDDNSLRVDFLKNYCLETDYGQYIHNTTDCKYEDNYIVDAVAGMRVSDDESQGAFPATDRVRGNSVQRNVISVNSGQKATSMRVISAYQSDSPWAFGTFANNRYDRVDADSYFTDIPFTAESQIDRIFSDYQTYTGLDATSEEEAFDRTTIQAVLNDSFSSATISLDGTWRDWDGNLYNGSIELTANESKILFFDSPAPSDNLWRYKKLVTPQDYFGNLIYDTYQTSKAANGNFEVPFVQIRNLVNNVKDFGWDLLCVPFTNKDDTVYSMIGPNLTVTGGGNGSKFNRFGLLETELPADRPRFTFNPETGIFEGVYLEVEDENRVVYSNDFLNQIYRTYSVRNIRLSPEISPDGSLNAFESFNESDIPSVIQVAEQNPNLFSSGYKSIFAKLNLPSGYGSIIYFSGLGELQALTNDWKRIVLPDVYTVAQGVKNFYVFDFRNQPGGNVLPRINVYGAQSSLYNTSYIKTGAAAVTRPADIYTATGAITGTTYTIVKYTSENKIAYYYDAGNKTTYIDGVNTGTVSEAPSNDFVISGTGSEKVQLMGLIEGVKTNQELIDLTI